MKINTRLHLLKTIIHSGSSEDKSRIGLSLLGGRAPKSFAIRGSIFANRTDLQNGLLTVSLCEDSQPAGAEL